MPVDSTTRAWFWLARPWRSWRTKQTGAIVAFGDSITDGAVDARHQPPVAGHSPRRLIAQRVTTGWAF